MEATSSSLSLVSKILGFEIVELWTESPQTALRCIYAHVEPEVGKTFSKIICGHHSSHAREHIVSPKICDLASRAPGQCFWRVFEQEDNKEPQYITYAAEVGYTIKSEMAYMLKNTSDDMTAYIVGFSRERIPMKKKDLQFLSGMAYSIYIAAFDLDEEMNKSLDTPTSDGIDNNDNNIVNDKVNNSICSKRSSEENDSLQNEIHCDQQASVLSANNSLIDHDNNNTTAPLNAFSYSEDLFDGNNAFFSLTFDDTDDDSNTNTLSNNNNCNNNDNDATVQQSYSQSFSFDVHDADFNNNITVDNHKIAFSNDKYKKIEYTASFRREYLTRYDSGNEKTLFNDGQTTVNVNNNSYDTNFSKSTSHSLSVSSDSTTNMLTQRLSGASSGASLLQHQQQQMQQRNANNQSCNTNTTSSSYNERTSKVFELLSSSSTDIYVSSAAASPSSNSIIMSHINSNGNNNNISSSNYNNTTSTNKSILNIKEAIRLELQESNDSDDNDNNNISDEKNKSSTNNNNNSNSMLNKTIATSKYPLSNIPIKHTMINTNMSLNQLLPMNLECDSNNCYIYSGRYNNNKVIIKVLSDKGASDPLALQEFDNELQLLLRIQHPNIIKLLGAGCSPKKFMVLECLECTFDKLLEANVYDKNHMSSKLFHKSTFSMVQVLSLGKTLAEIVAYLHYKFHDEACILVRDIKPENLGFDSYGCLKLFDLGLATCLYKRKAVTNNSTDSNNNNVAPPYQHNSNDIIVGSIRYMAPELLLKYNYTESIDTYSFGVVMWQMSRDRVPYKGYNKAEYMERVIKHQESLKIDKSWPLEYCQLLSQCWQRDINKRPTFLTIITTLTQLLKQIEANGSNSSNSNIDDNSSSKISTSFIRRLMKGGGSTSNNSNNSANHKTNKNANSNTTLEKTSISNISTTNDKNTGSTNSNNSSSIKQPTSPRRKSTGSTGSDNNSNSVNSSNSVLNHKSPQQQQQQSLLLTAGGIGGSQKKRWF